ncbi:MAG: prolyl oligopeptidase family serine peptidase [Candidatus Lokiarchaeota archaeon]|nr:prolyl oligopeptidase family serine peptidase [Candidatus Lokiarchaeota archaeon]
MREKKEKIYRYLFLLPFLLLFTGIILSNIGFHTVYDRVERYSAKYPDNDIPIIGNIYYPKCSVYPKPPVLVYMSGFMMQKDLDPRIPMEFCRRGFMVVSVDMHGHGEMGGIFGPKTYTDGKNAINYVYDYLSDIGNTSQVAVVGHSAGGLGALGLNDSRIQAMVTWAAPVYYSEELIANFEREFNLYNPEIDLSNRTLIEELNASAPYTIISEANPKNLLAIHHLEDPLVNISHAYEIQNKTNCTLIVLNETEQGYALLSNMDEATHGLLYDSVMQSTINWVEDKLNLHNVPINTEYKYISKMYIIAVTISLFSLIASSFSFIYYFCKHFNDTHRQPDLTFTTFRDRVVHKYKMEKNPKLKLLLPFIFVTFLFFLAFIIEWTINTFSSPFNMNLVFLIPSIFLGAILILFLLMAKIKIKIDLKGLIFSIFFTILLLGGFISYTIGFRTIIIYPHHFVNVFYAFIVISPYIILSSIVLWKVLFNLLPDMIFDPITEFTEAVINLLRTKLLHNNSINFSNEHNKLVQLRWKVIYIVIIQLLFNLLIFSHLPFTINILTVGILLLISGLGSALYYYLRREITSMILFNILILTYFYSTCYWFFPNFP